MIKAKYYPLTDEQVGTIKQVLEYESTNVNNYYLGEELTEGARNELKKYLEIEAVLTMHAVEMESLRHENLMLKNRVQGLELQLRVEETA